ncbi:MAG: hypothetical protein ACE5OZ_13900 [Candidatus Heimdallarchaeota archaeon]
MLNKTMDLEVSDKVLCHNHKPINIIPGAVWRPCRAQRIGSEFELIARVASVVWRPSQFGMVET